MIRTFLAVILGTFLLAPCTSKAQTTTTGTATALLVTPITLVKNVDLNFGNVAVSASVSGTVILSPGGTRSTGGSGGVTLPATTGTVSAANFTVSGQGGYTYSITLPATCTITDGSGHSMSIGSFTSSPAATGTLSTGGSQTLTVGATLSLTAGQASGSYSNGSGVPVTVNYN